jgi:hypothetical protein
VTIDELVDAFVDRINSSQPGRLFKKELPDRFIAGEPDDMNQYGWRIIPCDCADWIRPLFERLPEPFPESFQSLLLRYAFPSFEIQPITLFGNTGEDYLWELSDRIFVDPTMSPFILGSGYLQIGIPFQGDYDPICFDMDRRSKDRQDAPLVQLDHEEILCNSRVEVVKEIALSFRCLLEQHIKD